TGLISGTIEASADVFPVIVRATDAEGKFDEETFTITVRENLAPSLTAPPDATVNQGASFSYQIVASDSDPGDALTYSATNLPDNLSVAPQTGVISGTVVDEAGNYTVTVKATDPWGAFAEADFQIEVMYINQPPAASVTLDPEYCQGSSVTIAIQASDPEDETLAFSIDPSGDTLPDDLALNAATGVISGILKQTGTSATHNILVVVSDPE